MGNSQKGTALCIKQLITITLFFFHKIFKILLQENYLILFRTYFCNTFHFLSEFWSKIFSSILPILVIHPKGCDKATPIFLFFSCSWKMVEHFCVVLFASSMRWSKLFLENFWSLPDHHMGCGWATPIFVNNCWCIRNV